MADEKELNLDSKSFKFITQIQSEQKIKWKVFNPGSPFYPGLHFLVIKIEVEIIKTNQPGKQNPWPQRKQTQKWDHPAKVPGILYGA